MKTLKYNTKAQEVATLCEMLSKIGYSIVVSESFTREVDATVKDFQGKNNLVVDGIVGQKTWSKLIEKNSQFLNHNNKLLSEQDLIEFAANYQIELAVIKAVNEIESSGKGFLVSGKPKILFEGHVFWRELIHRGINPVQFQNSSTQDILHENWTKKYYLGGEAEYSRLEKARILNSSKNFSDAANAATSWGAFQILGSNAIAIGYSSIDEFVQKMYLNEREHLIAFGKFLEKNDLIPFLQNKDWVAFALHYNGQSYKANKYDKKLQKAYIRYS